MASSAFTRPYGAGPRGGPWKVWNIGDSFARNAVPVNAGASYVYTAPLRTVMFTDMTALNAQPNFVGTQLNSSESPAVTTAGTGHDGLNGSSAAQWRDSFFAAKVAQFATPAAMPHIITMILGNNDGDDSAAGTAIAAVVDLAAASAPLANIIVAEVLPSPTMTRTATNTQLRTEIAARQRAGYHVTLLDMQKLTAATTGVSDMPDGQHPSDNLYRRMGKAFMLAIAPLLS